LVKAIGLPFELAIPTSLIIGMLVGLFLSFPAGRVRDIYLAMMTLAFGLIFGEVIREWDDVTGGAVGLSGYPALALHNLLVLNRPVGLTSYFYLVLATTIITMSVVRNLTKSDFGRAMMTVKSSEVAAGSVGISSGHAKRITYSVASAIAALAGSLYAHMIGYLGPDSFDLAKSIEILVITVVGGLGSMAGQVISATLLTILPERLQVFLEYQFIVYGLVLTFSLIILPRGIGGLLFSPPRFIKSTKANLIQPLEKMVCDTRPDIVEIRAISKKFGGLLALDQVSFELRAGHVTALVGPNGSGKSTLVNIISGIYEPTGGDARFGSEIVTGLKDHEVARLGIRRTFQDPRLVGSFTARENILAGAHLSCHAGLMSEALGLSNASHREAACLVQVDELLALVDLTNVADVPIADLPYGFHRLIEICRAVVSAPRVLLLDEPAAGLTAPEIETLVRLIDRMKQSGMIIMLIEHHMDFVARVSDSVIVLESGSIVFQGSAADMRHDARVVEAYLGNDATLLENANA
jgi:branched-chain amino acid transport system permease protein